MEKNTQVFCLKFPVTFSTPTFLPGNWKNFSFKKWWGFLFLVFLGGFIFLFVFLLIFFAGSKSNKVAVGVKKNIFHPKTKSVSPILETQNFWDNLK